MLLLLIVRMSLLLLEKKELLAYMKMIFINLHEIYLFLQLISDLDSFNLTIISYEFGHDNTARDLWT